MRQEVAVSSSTRTGPITPETLGLRAVRGSVATIDGVTYYGTSGGWSLESPPAELSAGDPVVSAELLLGFSPAWMAGVTSVVVNESGHPVAAVPLNTRLYATVETASRLAAALGATAVPLESGGGATQWELEFPSGRRLNAGLVADLFVRDPHRAFARLQTELGRG